MCFYIYMHKHLSSDTSNNDLIQRNTDNNGLLIKFWLGV